MVVVEIFEFEWIFLVFFFDFGGEFGRGVHFGVQFWGFPAGVNLGPGAGFWGFLGGSQKGGFLGVFWVPPGL